jgi:hypothetical protein
MFAAACVLVFEVDRVEIFVPAYVSVSSVDCVAMSFC